MTRRPRSRGSLLADQGCRPFQPERGQSGRRRRMKRGTHAHSRAVPGALAGRRWVGGEALTGWCVRGSSQFSAGAPKTTREGAGAPLFHREGSGSGFLPLRKYTRLAADKRRTLLRGML